MREKRATVGAYDMSVVRRRACTEWLARRSLFETLHGVASRNTYVPRDAVAATSTTEKAENVERTPFRAVENLP